MSISPNNNFHSPLNKNDTEEYTVGCRHTNSNICKNNSLEKYCALVRSDGICKMPPSTWKKQYHKLLKMNNSLIE
jgi:hypothetical protein